MKNYIARGAPPLLSLPFSLWRRLAGALFLLLWLTHYGCLDLDDEDPTTIAGRVLEFGTDKPIPGALVKVLNCSGALLGSISCGLVGTVTTDANGYYQMPYPEGGGGLTANAKMPGYFTDTDSEVCVCTPVDKVDIRLHPHAWIRVKIKNESGAWGFYPQSTQSGIPPITLEQGKDSILVSELDFRKGNDSTKYSFSARLFNGAGTPPMDYWQNVKAYVNSQEVPIKANLGATIKFYIPGHDTTNLTIIY
jgi:hypothetical protein